MKLESFVLGEGEPLLFLGGANSTFSYYPLFLKLLSEKYKVYFFNYPGLGKSDAVIGEHTLETYISAIESFVKQKGLESFHLAGASFGGFLAIEYAYRTQNTKIKSLLLFAPLSRTFTKSKILNGLRIGATHWQKKRTGHLPLTISVFNLKNFDRWQSKIKHSDFVLTLALDRKHIRDDIPTLIVVGENDLVVDTAHTKKLFEGKKSVEIITFKTGGHDAFATQGEKILDIISDFTKRL